MRVGFYLVIYSFMVAVLSSCIYMIPSLFSCVKAKQRYEREERRKELKRQRGEDTWMLPEVDQRLQEMEDVR